MKMLTTLLAYRDGLCLAFVLLEAEGRDAEKSGDERGMGACVCRDCLPSGPGRVRFSPGGDIPVPCRADVPCGASILVTLPALVLALIFAGIVKWWNRWPE